ncbi:heavy metal translocating P-type ATPase [Rugamonas sp. DEMB1]|uniref:heavy metal translocating P-type ATPase n=1 Tax=Rugamonas sp. DEMB1 TaxID=3039386 RepID=UPI00244BF963|nr:heavy metal translocating P-type ATPase [Rugamonas sp. DEMB1]WGG52802.1 heavy metal translocating P-type ATPase [Rugamonas sp. DEMB1]
MSDSDCSHCDCSSAAAPTAAPVAPPSPAGAGSAQYRIDNMDCPTEEALIRAKLAGVAGVSGLDFNLMQRTLTVKHSLDSLHTVEAALDAIDMRAQRLDTLAAPTDAAPPAKAPWWPMALAGACALASETAHWIIGDNHWLVVALALAAIAGAGLSTYKKGWIALKNRELNMNALMSVAVTGAVLIGHWPEAAMVMFLFALAELIEARSLDRARDAIRSLLDLAPQTATVQQLDGAWLETPASAVAVGAVVRLRPGERIALDGVVSSGRSTVNQAPITGESLPVDKAEGDSVFAGTINQSGSFEFRVTAEAGNSALARIVQAVESAQGSRAPTQRFVDRFARVYTPSVVVGALLLALLPPLLFGGEWLDWAYRALVVLVIACPCALVISTPVTIVSGLAAAARKGILVKGGVYLEEGRKLRVLALDKTGTITHGKPAQTDFVVLGGDAAQIRSDAASLAARSDHPVSLAIAQAALADGVAAQPVDDFAAIAGRGVRGSIAGRLYQLGNHRLIEELGQCSPAIEAQLFALERQGKTAVMLADEAGVLAIFAVADTVRETSRQAIADLHTLGVRTLMLSGDNTQTAEAIAKLVGIDEASGNLLPEDKLAKIGALQADAGGGLVGMVGDGINDAPALARAHIGFAMGAVGADSAIETADVALMDDDLRKIPAFIRLSRATARVLTQNIALALGIKAVFLVLTFTGQATMWMAVFADMGASLLVVANGLRLLRR